MRDGGMAIEPAELSDVLNVEERKIGLSVMCSGLEQLDGQDAVPEMQSSGERTVCKFVNFQINDSAAFNLLMLRGSFIFYSLLMLFPFRIGDSLLKSATRTLLEFNTTADCDGDRRARHKTQSSITFLCGKTLVSAQTHFMIFCQKCLPLGGLAIVAVPGRISGKKGKHKR